MRGLVQILWWLVTLPFRIIWWLIRLPFKIVAGLARVALFVAIILIIAYVARLY